MRHLSAGIVVGAMALLSYSYAAQTSIYLTILPGTGDVTSPTTGEISTGGNMSGDTMIPTQFAGGSNISLAGRGNTISGFVLGSAPDSGDVQELENATLLEWGQYYGLISGVQELSRPISRIDLAKMMTLFIRNVWSISIHANPECDVNHYADYRNIPMHEREYVKTVCDLGVMGRNGTRTALTAKFNPYQIVTRDQLVTIFSRLLYGNAYDSKSTNTWYEGHMRIMLSEGFITKPNPSIIEVRSNILLILRRIAQAIPNGSIMINTRGIAQKSGDELQKAYSRAKQYNITPLPPSYTTGPMYNELTRGELAHMLVMFSKNILGKVSIGTDTCTIENYTDFSGMNELLQQDIKEACNLGLMGRSSNGSILTAFRPHDIVLRAELGAVLSRMLYGDTYNHVTEGKARYTDHLQALVLAGYLTKVDTPFMTERNGYVLIILQRIAEKLKPSL